MIDWAEVTRAYLARERVVVLWARTIVFRGSADAGLFGLACGVFAYEGRA